MVCVAFGPRVSPASVELEEPSITTPVDAAETACPEIVASDPPAVRVTVPIAKTSGPIADAVATFEPKVRTAGPGVEPAYPYSMVEPSTTMPFAAALIRAAAARF